MPNPGKPQLGRQGETSQDLRRCCNNDPYRFNLEKNSGETGGKKRSYDSFEEYWTEESSPEYIEDAANLFLE